MDDNESLVSSVRGLNNPAQLWFQSCIKDDYCYYRRKIDCPSKDQTDGGSITWAERDLRDEASWQACVRVSGVLTCLSIFSSRSHPEQSLNCLEKRHFKRKLGHCQPTQPLLCHLSSVCPVHCGSCCTAGRWLGCWSPCRHLGFFLWEAHRVLWLLLVKHLREAACWVWKRPKDS